MTLARRPRAWLAGGALAVAAGLLAGCASGPPPTEPVLADDFADPDVVQTDEGYWAYSTESNRQTVPTAFSEDLVTWERRGDAMPELPSWVIPGKTWAPEVTALGPDRFALYFTATDFESGRQCIGVAISPEAGGPFEVQGDGMLVCPAEDGGAIDASTAVIDGQRWLVWKNDGNAVGVDTWIQAAPLTDDGLALDGETVRLIRQDQAWEGELVEAPTLIVHDEGLTLLYSANSYGGDEYAIGYATAPSMDGPWTKAEEPLLTTAATGDEVRGPGGQDVVAAPDGSARLVFHGWDPSYTYRSLHVAPLEWDGLEPVVDLG
ncbi:arabinan endo-1,5-alpha-L-arabinosidase [Agrococcus sp. UYP33]